MRVIAAAYIHNKKFHNRLISAYTWIFNIGTPATSHIELVMPLMGKYMCFSSTNRDGASGTRWQDPKKVFKHPERWKFYSKDYYENDVEDMVKRADGILDCGYDWWGIAGFATPLGLLNAKEGWYCSEACWMVLKKWVKRVSPRRFCRWIVKKLGFIAVRYTTIEHLFV